MARRSTRKEMVIILSVYAAVLAIMGLDHVVNHFDQPLLDISTDVLLVILFAVAAVLMFIGKIMGYYAMIAALAIQAVLELLSLLSDLGGATVNSIASALALLAINLFIIIWLLQGENRIVSR